MFNAKKIGGAAGEILHPGCW